MGLLIPQTYYTDVYIYTFWIRYTEFQQSNYLRFPLWNTNTFHCLESPLTICRIRAFLKSRIIPRMHWFLGFSGVQFNVSSKNYNCPYLHANVTDKSAWLLNFHVGKNRFAFGWGKYSRKGIHWVIWDCFVACREVKSFAQSTK